MPHRAKNSPRADEQIRAWGVPSHFKPVIHQVMAGFLDDPAKKSRDPPCPPFPPIGRVFEFSLIEDPFCYYFRLHFFFGPREDELTITAAVMQPAYQEPPPGSTPGVTSP